MIVAKSINSYLWLLAAHLGRDAGDCVDSDVGCSGWLIDRLTDGVSVAGLPTHKGKEKKWRDGQEGQDYATIHLCTYMCTGTSQHLYFALASASFPASGNFVSRLRLPTSAADLGAAQSADCYLEITRNVWGFGCHASVGQSGLLRERQRCKV